jgi:hypothetical protein
MLRVHAPITSGPNIILPQLQLRLARRLMDIDPSIVQQLDGALFTLFGTRIECDFLANDATDTFCAYFGRQQNTSMASAVGLYLHDPTFMPQVVAAALTHQACGVFIVPVVPGQRPLILTKPNIQPIPWFDLLLSHSKLTVQLPSEGILQNAMMHPCPTTTKFVAIFARFGITPRFKTKIRPERSRKTLSLSCINSKTRRLGPRPVLHHRVCEFADELSPTRADDKAPWSPPFPVQPDLVMPAPRPTNWDIKLWTTITSDYPCSRTRDIALMVMSNTLDTFVGIRAKPVDQPTRVLEPQVANYLRAKTVAETAKGYNAGPYSVVPFPNARVTPLGSKVKDKYDPQCEEYRVTHDFRAGHPHSINSCYWNPLWLTVFLSVTMVMDQIAARGPGVRVTIRDIPAAFKMNSNPIWLLFLHVSTITTQEHGTEFFIELANEFGNLVSEYGWQAILAMILHVLPKLCIRDIDYFVDNCFEYHPPSSTADTAAAEAAETDSFFDSLGIKRHQQESATMTFYGLGWDFDLHPNHPEWDMVIRCPTKKHVYYAKVIPEWAAATTLNLNQLDKACGSMTWLASGFKAGTPYIAPLYAMRAQALSVHSKSSRPRSMISIKVTPNAREALSFWASVFTRWDGICPIMASFGPNTGPQRHGMVDASGTACGGFMRHANGTNETVMRAFYHEFTKDEIAAATTESGAISSGFLELLGIYWWLRYFGAQCRGFRLLLETDSEAAAQAMLNAYSDTARMRPALRDTRTIAAHHFIDMRIRQVDGVCFNMVSDSISRGQFSKAKAIARTMFGAPLLMVPSPSTPWPLPTPRSQPQSRKD